MGYICDGFFQFQISVLVFLPAVVENFKLHVDRSSQCSHVCVMAGYLDQGICIVLYFLGKSNVYFFP